MKGPFSSIVALWSANALTRRVLGDALLRGGYKLEAAGMDSAPGGALLADAGVPPELRLAYEKAGLPVLLLDDEGAAVRLGAVLARLRRVMAGGAKAMRGMLAFGPFRLDLAYMALYDVAQDKSVNLTEKERDILARLHRENGGALDRRTLLEDIWGYGAAVETHTLETHIYRLRQKLEVDPTRPVILVTDGNGYRLAMDAAPSVAV